VDAKGEGERGGGSCWSVTMRSAVGGGGPAAMLLSWAAALDRPGINSVKSGLLKIFKWA
jgi:hypothetical protein